jgi:hypothetical protein
MAAIRHLKLVGPGNIKRTVALPVRKPNAVYRSREHLTEREVERRLRRPRTIAGVIVTQPWSCWPLGTV